MGPARVQVVDLGPAGRGPTVPSKVACRDTQVCVTGPQNFPTVDEVHDFVDGLDVVWSAETFYHPDLVGIAAGHGCATVLHANPELVRADHTRPTATWLPTSWEQHRLPYATVVPHPAPSGFARIPVGDTVDRLFHVAAPAMRDRNGTKLFAGALKYVDVATAVTVHGNPEQHGQRPNRVTIPAQVHNATVERSDEIDSQAFWPAEPSVVVMARRYGGLCLPLWEAAAQGLPVVTLDVAPLNEWVHPSGLVAARRHSKIRAPGSYDSDGRPTGWFVSWACQTRDLAAAIAALCTEPGLAAANGQHHWEWAQTNSWENLKPVWTAALEAACL